MNMLLQVLTCGFVCTQVVLANSFITADYSRANIFRQFSGGVVDFLSTSTTTISIDCAGALHRLSSMAESYPNLLARYLNLWGKPSCSHDSFVPENIGTVTYIGDYDGCVGLTDTQLGDVSYCIYDMEMSVSTGAPSRDLVSSVLIKVGVCHPTLCSAEDFAIVLSHIDFNSDGVSLVGGIGDGAVSVTIDSKGLSSCPVVDVNYDVTTRLTLIVCGVLCGLVVVGTLLDYFIMRDENSHVKSDEVLHVGSTELFTSFSLVKNMSFVLTTKPSSTSLKAVGGIRVISMFWIIANHTWQAVNMYNENVINKSAASSKVKQFSFQPIINVTFAVETFILLGGLLTAYTAFMDMERHGKFRTSYYYIYRFFRISSLYYLFIFVAIKVIPKLGSGPVYNWRLLSYDTCQQYWWTNILYINNIVPVLSCLGHTWYMALDMQFFIVSPLFVVLLYKNRRIGLGVIAVVMIASVTIVGVITAVNKHNANLFADPDFVSNIKYLYCKPYFRINAYLIGIVLGYILHKKYTFPVSSLQNFVSVILPALLCLPVIYSTYQIWHNHPFRELENLLYQMFSRTVWSVGIAIIIYSCNQYSDGLIQKSANRVLSWNGWDPLVKLTFAAYLIHYVVLDYIMGTMRTSYVFSDHVYMVMFMTATIVSYSIAVLMTLCVELPIINIVKLLFEAAGIQPREKLCS